MSNTLDTSNIEFRCGLCNKFMRFDTNLIDKHYRDTHGKADNWQKYTDLNALLSQLANNRKATQFMHQINANEIENDPELSFLSAETIDHTRNFANAIGARLYKFSTLKDGHAYKFTTLGDGSKADLDIFISEYERKLSARSLARRDVNLNHYLYMPSFNYVCDAEEVNGAVVGLMLIEDAFINKLFDLGLVEGVSVEYYKRQEACACKPGACNCEQSGIVFDGLGIISMPFQPADPESQMLQVMRRDHVASMHECMAAELAGPSVERLLSMIQGSVKERIAGPRRAKLQLSRDLNDHLRSNESIVKDRKDNLVEKSTCTNKGKNDMNEQETTQLIEKQLSTLKAQYEGKIETLENELQSTKADLLSLVDQQRRERETLIVGHGRQTNAGEILPDEYKKFRDARIATASFEEIVLFEAASKGVDIRNKRELDAWFEKRSSA